MSAFSQAVEFLVTADTANFKKEFDALDRHVTTRAKLMQREFKQSRRGEKDRFGLLDNLIFGVDGAAGFRSVSVRAIGSISSSLVGLAARGGVVGAAIGAAFSLQEAFVGAFVETAHALDDVRKKLGVTREEMFQVGDAITSSGLKYGASFGRLSNILTTISTGSRAAKKDVLELGGAIDLVARSRGGDAARSTKAVLDLTTALGFSADRAFVLQDTLAAVGEKGGARVDEMNEALISMREELQTLGKSKPLEPVIADATSLLSLAKELGGEEGFQGVAAAIKTALSGASDARLSQLFRSGGLMYAFDELARISRDVTQLGDRTQQKEMYGVTEAALSTTEKMMDAFESRRALFIDKAKRDREQIEKEAYARMSPFEQMGVQWDRIHSSVEAVAVAVNTWIEPTMKKVADWSKMIGDEFEVWARVASAKDSTVVDRITNPLVQRAAGLLRYAPGSPILSGVGAAVKGAGAAMEQLPQQEVKDSVADRAVLGAADLAKTGQTPMDAASWSVGSMFMQAAKYIANAIESQTETLLQDYSKTGSVMISPPPSSAPASPRSDDLRDMRTGRR